MRRTELTHGLDQVRHALIASELESRLASLFLQEERLEDDVFKEHLLDALKTFAVATERFTPAAHAVARTLKLHVLAESATWIQLLSASDRRIIRLLHERVRIATKHLPDLAALITPEPLTTEDEVSSVGSTLTIVVAADGRAIAPRRLTAVLTGLERLYEIIAHVGDTDSEPLTVVASDTGDDLTMDVVGTPEVITPLKQLFIELADRLVFFRSINISDRLGQATSRLTLLNEIEEQRGHGRLSPEQAELLRRGVRDHAVAVLEAAAFIPEMEEHTRFDPRELIGPAPRLLPDPSEAPTSKSAAPEATAQKPWHITPALPTRQPDAAAPEAEDDAIPQPSDDASAGTDDEKTEEPAFENRAAYLLHEIKRPASQRRRQ